MSKTKVLGFMQTEANYSALRVQQQGHENMLHVIKADCQMTFSIFVAIRKGTVPLHTKEFPSIAKFRENL